MPSSTVSTSSTRTPAPIWRSRPFMTSPDPRQELDEQVDELDAEEWHDDTSGAVDEQIAAQQRTGARGCVADAAQGQRDQREDHQGVEDDRGEDCRLRRVQAHDVEPVQAGIHRGEERWDDREVL